MCYDREQRLIDIMFNIVHVMSDPEHLDWVTKAPMEHKAEWLRKNLSDAGFPTRAIGSSWGILQRQIQENDNEKGRKD